MRILFLSQLVPYPPDAGAKVRSYHVVQYLAKAGHEVILVAFQRASDEPESIEHLHRYCAGVHVVPMKRSRARDAWHFGRSLVSGEPFLIARDHVDSMCQMIERLIGRQSVDTIHADQLWMAQYALAARAQSERRGSSVRLVLDQHNAMYLIPDRLATSTSNWIKKAVLSREARQMRKYEVETCQQFDRVVWVTDEDRSAFGWAAMGSAEHLTIPICVDPADKPQIQRQHGAQRVTFLGGLHWPPNADGVIWFAHEVWPRVLAQVPEALLTIIGKSPPPELTNEKTPVANLDVTGYVDDLEPYLAQTAVFIVPLLAGGGMRVKIVDAWSWGLPVVSTTIGAEGLYARDGQNLLIRDDPGSLADAVVDVLQRPALADALADAGRATVESRYDWRKVYSAWDQIYGPPNGRA